MHLIQRIAALVSGAVLLAGIAVLPVSAEGETESAKETFTDGMFTFAYVDDGVELCGCQTTAFSVRLPSETNGKRIVGIADGAFYNCTTLQSVFLSDGIRYLGKYAFAGCESLLTLEIPDTVETIGDNAFSGCIELQSLQLPAHLTEIPEGMCYTCVSLTDVNIPDGVTKIGVEAFYDCMSLARVEIPDGVSEFGNYAFAFCSAMTEIKIPESCTKLASGVFCGCESVTEFTVPDQMEDIGSLTFMGCTRLTDFYVEEGNVKYKAQDGVLYSPDMTTLFSYPAGNSRQSFTIPEGVTTVYDTAFFRAENLTEVNFPSTLQYVGAGAFEYCAGLKSALLPEGTLIIYENGFADCTALHYVSLPSTLKGVGGYAFYNCPALKEITIPASCKTVGENAFGYIENIDADGNATPAKMEGFKEHRTSGMSVWTIVAIVIGVIVLGAVVYLLVRVIRKNQMTAEEHDANVMADEEYESIAEEPDGNQETTVNNTKEE